MSLLGEISQSLQVPSDYLLALSHRASFEYRQYYVLKSHGGKRLINHPSKELKAVQRWLYQNIIHKWPVHAAAAAYRAGTDILSHAAPHARYSYLLRLDLQEFFPSITEVDIDTYLTRNQLLMDVGPGQSRTLFKRFVTLNGRLTIGAPSSPAISNALCFDLDAQLAELTARREIIYSRYADDFFFSTNIPNILKEVPVLVQEVLARLDCPARLRLNPKKILHLSRARRRTVTGIVLSPDGRALLGRDVKRRVRALVHRYDSLNSDGRQSLAGLIAYAIGIDPDFLNALVLKYGHDRIATARRVGVDDGNAAHGA